jgi:membrane glycosyltransferase
MREHVATIPLEIGNPASQPPRPDMRLRRLAFFSLVVVTMAAMITTWTAVVSSGGFTGFEIAMVVLFSLNLPWLVIGFWNSVIGVILLHFRRDWLKLVLPVAALDDTTSPIRGRVAAVMPVYNEEPERVFARIQAMAAAIEASGHGDQIEFFLLSDTNKPEIWAEEEARFAVWRQSDPRPERLHYRRRAYNFRQKVGNIEDFCERWCDDYEYMVVLDADSVMSGEAMLRMIRIIQANPKIGILQTLVTGTPATSAFARIFQFGMRHGMRSWTTGSAWWHGDAGPYWGHNAVLRLQPFRQHCTLPKLKGKPPLGGEVLSHDQVEAVMLRSAGYEVRVYPVEDGSFEDNPTTLPDYIKRDLRWCQGNIQYMQLLTMPKVLPLGRLQLLLAIIMYTMAPVWYLMMVTGLVDIVTGAVFGRTYLDQPAWIFGDAARDAGLWLFVTVMGMNFAPKLLGILDVMLRPAERRRYGGALALFGGTLAEILFSILLTPMFALAQTMFIIGLFFGRRILWEAQGRADRPVSFAEALGGLWPHLLAGVVMLSVLAIFAPGILPWAAPVIVGLVLGIPVAVLTANAAFGRFCAAAGVRTTPEDREVPEILRQVGFGPAPALAPTPSVPELPHQGPAPEQAS